jgi:hypothetical protein
MKQIGGIMENAETLAGRVAAGGLAVTELDGIGKGIRNLTVAWIETID